MPVPDPLVELLDEGRAHEQAMGRARARAFDRMAEEGAQLAGTLIDLAERRSPVALRTEGGRTHHGVITTVGADHLRLRADSGSEPLVRLSAVVAVRVRPGEGQPAATGDRAPADDQRLLEALGRLVDERQRVTLVVRGGEVLAGRLRSVGQDVVSIDLDGEGGLGCYVPGPAITEVWLDS